MKVVRTAIRKYRDLPLVSGGLVLINVVVFLICSFTGGTLYAKGGLSVLEVVVNGEFGRILWAMFLHSGIEHIFNNMLILFFMGSMIEKEIGHVPFAVLYFLSGMGGNLVSLLNKIMANDWSMSIGASGAVFGLNGVLLAMVIFSGRRLSTVTPARVILMIILSLYNGFTGEYIDNAAHIGGLITGFLAGTVVCILQRRKIRSVFSRSRSGQDYNKR